MKTLFQFATQCAWCGMIRDESGWWVLPDTGPCQDLPITHGICPACANRLADEIGKGTRLSRRG